MTKDIIITIINRLSEININVVAIVSDNCPANTSCWKELGADYNNPFFPHPVTKNNVYVVPDVPHLLKLTRNWLVDHGFKYKEKNITIEPLKKFLKVELLQKLHPYLK